MSKNIVILCDGTWQSEKSKHTTNVVKMKVCLQDDDTQKVYYDSGVGAEWFNKFLGGALGAGLNKNILEAYQYIVDNYSPSDKLYLIGFSRGAYTVRSLAGLIYNSGIVDKRKPDYHKLIKEAFEIYKDRYDVKKEPKGVEAKKFRQENCIKNENDTHFRGVHFIGVWDTVGALGVPGELDDDLFRFHDVKLNKEVKFAYHALAIDEERDSFKPCLWECDPSVEGQTLEQVWFSGVHSNIGGGYELKGLSDITFAWMAKKAIGAELKFNDKELENVSMDISGHIYNSKDGAFEKLPSSKREIAIGDIKKTKERVSSLVIDRFKNSSDYQKSASNLKHLMERKDLKDITANHKIVENSLKEE